MEHHPFPLVLVIEHFPKAGHKYNRELQPFAFVDAHDPHHVLCLLPFRKGEIHIVLLQLLHVADKMEQAPVAGIFIGNCLLHQHFQICLPDFPAGKGIDIRLVASFLQHLVKQFVDGGVAGLFPEFFQ